MTHPLDEVINLMCCRKLWRRPGVKLELPNLDDARLSAKEIQECTKDYDSVIVWGKNARQYKAMRRKLEKEALKCLNYQV